MEYIYILTDSDMEAIIAFENKERAIREAKECGCDVSEVRIVSEIDNGK